MADMIDSSKISFACELDKDLETPTTESNTEARVTFTETQIVLGLGNDKSIKYKATGSGTDLSNYYNKSEVDEKLKLKTDKTQLDDYYNKSEVDSALGNKVDTTTLTTNYYNKTETDNLLDSKVNTTTLENYYKKSEVDSELLTKVDTTTLDNYDLSTVVDSKVEGVSNKIGNLSALETGVKDTVVNAINEVKRAQTEAGKVTNLNDLGDVNASAPRRGQFLGWDQDTLKWVSKDVETDGMDTHMADFNNPHRTTISNLNDTTITNPQNNQALVYDGAKWVNKSVSLDDSNYAKKNVTNTFTKPQIIPNGTASNHSINKGQLDSGLGTKVSKTGNETIAGTKTFSSPVVIPNATANNQGLPKGQADTLYAKISSRTLTWLVGSGGTYTTLQQAFNAAEKYVGPSKIIIKIKNGYTQINTARYNGITPLDILPENVEQIFNFTGEVWSSFMNFGVNTNRINIFDLKIKGTNSGSIGIGNLGEVNLIRCEFSGNIVPVYASSGVLTVYESFKANLTSKNNCFDINVNATMYLKSPKTNTIITNANRAFRADRTARICIFDNAGATINKCTIGFAVTNGGIMSIENKGNISFSGTTTQYSQAANVATKEGIIFM